MPCGPQRVTSLSERFRVPSGGAWPRLSGNAEFSGHAAALSVHPHARRDNCLTALSITGSSGSPPRPWGQFPWSEVVDLRRRFTPTPVGTMPAAAPAMGAGIGSPPRPWGQCVAALHAHGRFRFTPRPWGQSRQTVPRLRHRRFTPTPVGTMNWTDREGEPEAGSPPRPWGQFLVRIKGQVLHRFTPTPVGTMIAVPLTRKTCCGSPPRPWGQYSRRHL